MVMAAIARAQRSVHPRVTADVLLKEELARIGRSDPTVEDFAKKIFADSGTLRDSPGEVMSKARQVTADKGGAEDNYLERDPRVLPLRNTLGVRHHSFAQAVESMCESAWSDWPLSGPRTCLFVLSSSRSSARLPSRGTHGSLRTAS